MPRLISVSATSPANILVRAYENRSDLLRCLIIGPLDTPFQNAPFLFDVYLSPAKFPSDPPQVYFHSWATGARVSPNLYVEGKVCLSLLGTWSGDKTEVSFDAFLSEGGVLLIYSAMYVRALLPELERRSEFHTSSLCFDPGPHHG